MIGVDVQINARQLQRFLEELTVRELPFAMSMAMNRAAQDSLDYVRREVPRRFTVRSPGVLRGFRVQPSHKRQWPRLQVALGTVDEFWVLQQFGGTKKPQSGRNLAIPTRLTRRTKTGKIAKAQRPRALIAAGKARVADGAIRKARANKRDRRTMLFLLRRQARIKPRLALDRLVHDSFPRFFPRNFGRAFAHAKRTSRERALRVKERG